MLILVLVALAGLSAVIGCTPRGQENLGLSDTASDGFAWASRAVTIDEVAAEADAIVRVRVIRASPARAMVSPLPSAQGEIGRLDVDVIPFTESTMEVLEVYKGSVGGEIVVTQTGGQLPATEIHPALDLEMNGNPLFKPGSEHVLFLVGPTVIGGVEGVYRPVSPTGRYEIREGRVASPADYFGSYSPPQELDDLSGRIMSSLGG